MRNFYRHYSDRAGARGNDFASASLRVIALDVCGLCACMKSRQFAGFFLRLLSGVKRLGRETKSGRNALPSIDSIAIYCEMRESMGVLDWFKNRSFQFDSDSEAEERAFLNQHAFLVPEIRKAETWRSSVW